MWIYHQRSGELFHGDDTSGAPVATGYSGKGEGKNNHLLQNVAKVGPLPAGVYWIGEPRDSKDHGPFVLPLTPVTGTQMFGRSAFLIHGDNAAHLGESSEGCIILPRDIRELIASSGDVLLVVTPGPAIAAAA